MSEQMQYVLMPNTAHFPMLEDAENYLKITQSFLTGTDKPVGADA